VPAANGTGEWDAGFISGSRLFARENAFVWHPYVHNHEVELAGLDYTQRLGHGISRRHGKREIVEIARQQAEVVPIVIDEKDAGTRSQHGTSLRNAGHYKALWLVHPGDIGDTFRGDSHAGGVSAILGPERQT
jgi:hypothetical protein